MYRLSGRPTDNQTIIISTIDIRALKMLVVSSTVRCGSFASKLIDRLQGPPMLVDKTNFGSVNYNHTNIYRFEETPSYWSVKRISVFLCISLVTSDTPPASQCVTVQ